MIHSNKPIHYPNRRFLINQINCSDKFRHRIAFSSSFSGVANREIQ